MTIGKKAILSAKNIEVSLGDKRIIKDLSVDIMPNRIVSIIGPNGSGKTTLLRALSRNIKLSNGEVYLQGENIHLIKSKNVAKKLAVLSQSYVCPSDITVRDLISYGRFAHKKWWSGSSKEDENIVDWALERTNMEHLTKRKMHTLSGGERQRAWIAMAISQKPEVLLLDEPTTYLDICHQVELLELVESLNKEDGITIVMVLHDINQAARYSNELLVMKDGEVIDKGEPSEVVNKNTLKKVFGIDAEIFVHEKTKRPFIYSL